MVKALLDNMQLNGLTDEQRMQANVFRWGADLKEEWIEKDCDLWPYDVIVGADIVRILKANTVWKN